jgi:hypothetical protein
MKETFAVPEAYEPKKKSKFLNHLLEVGDEFIGIYQGWVKTRNNYTDTKHYKLEKNGEDFILDSRDNEVFRALNRVRPQARVKIIKVYKENRVRFEVESLY